MLKRLKTETNTEDADNSDNQYEQNKTRLMKQQADNIDNNKKKRLMILMMMKILTKSC